MAKCNIMFTLTLNFPGSRLKSKFKDVLPLRAVWRKLRTRFLTPPKSDGYVESQHFDVVHFVTQVGYTTSCPTIYQPHDLQHLHHPEFFSRDDFEYREKSYRVLSDQATFVCVQTEWCKGDVIEKLGIPSDKIAVVKWGCVLEAYEPATPEELEVASQGLDIPPQFFLYPAVTWPHKNHECILRALKQVKDSYGRIVHVCFTGRSTEHRSYLEAVAAELAITEQVHYLGFVTSKELQALFLTATAMVYPSKFEGFGLPILEAFQSSLPVICARASCLPEVAQDAAMYFDPNSADQLAGCMLKMLDEPDVRRDYIRRGDRVLSNSSFKQTAAEFQLLYRKIAGLHRRDGVSNPESEVLGLEKRIQAK